MINTWSDLVAAFKAWWHAPIKLERTQPEPMTPEEFKKLPPNVMSILNGDHMGRLRDQYYEELRARRRRGERLSSEEMYRLRMHDDINHINYGLDHPDDFWKD